MFNSQQRQGPSKPSPSSTFKATTSPYGNRPNVSENEGQPSVGSTSGFGIRPKLTKTRSRARSILGSPTLAESVGRGTALSPLLTPSRSAPDQDHINAITPNLSFASIPEIRSEDHDECVGQKEAQRDIMPSLNLDMIDKDVTQMAMTGHSNSNTWSKPDGENAEYASPVRMAYPTGGQTGDRYGYGHVGSSRYQSHPIPQGSPSVPRSPSTTSLVPHPNGTRSNREGGLSRRLSSPNMRSMKTLPSPTSRSHITKTPTKLLRESGLGLTVDEPSEMVLPSLASSSANAAGDAVTSAVSSTTGKTRYRSGSVGSQLSEIKTANSIVPPPLGQPPRSRYNRSYTTSRVDAPYETFAKGEKGILSSLEETTEVTSNPPSPGDVKGKGRAYAYNLGIDVYPDDIDTLRLDEGYVSRGTSHSFGSTDDRSLQTGSSLVPSTSDGSSHLVELATPTVTSAAGGILTGLWFAGKQAGKAIGLLPPDLSANIDGYQNDAGYSQGKRRSGAWMSHLSIRRTSASDGEESEKGLLSHEESDAEDDKRRPMQQQGPLSYFDLPKTIDSKTSHTLPTPALSSKSLSHSDGRSTNHGSQRKQSTFSLSSFRKMKQRIWRGDDYSPTEAMPSPDAKAHREGRGRSGTLTRSSQTHSIPHETVKMEVALKQVVGELGWTLGTLGLVFVVSLGIVAASLVSLPISSLKSLPKKVSDLQLLSAEIKSYMSSSTAGWWHTIFVLMVTGMWKHSWSVPGAVVLNILVGSLLPPLEALILLTVITSFGSLGAYLLSRPLAPLIALIFPKPLALVRSAINGSDHASDNIGMDDLSTRRPANKPTAKPTVWRRLLIMRAMGLVPWSGMNVACGVVGVSPVTFLLTTAAGTASWSYVTASVGDILQQMALPGQIDAGSDVGSAGGGQSLSSLVRDPALIFKMVVLSLISLIPVLFKSRSNPVDSVPPPAEEEDLDYHAPPLLSPSTQAMTPLGPSPSFYAFVAIVNNMYRRTSRALATGWKHSVASALGASSDHYQALQTATADARTGFANMQDVSQERY